MILELIERVLDRFYSYIPRSKPQPDKIQNTRIIAHRGAHDKKSGIIENTHTAFQRARDLGCWGIEFDIHTTNDGVIVVNHDPTLLRLWGHDAAIRSISFAELRLLAPDVPTLEEVIQRYGHHMNLFIELKAPFAAESNLVTLLQQLTPREDYYLISLDEPVLAALTQFPKEALLLVAVHNNVKEFCQYALSKGYGGILGHFLFMTDKVIQQLKAEDKLFGVGFVDSKFSLYREINRDIGWLYTNNVGALVPYM